MNITPHHKRIATSLVLLPVLAWAVFHGDPFLSLVITGVAGLGLWEFYAMFWPEGHKQIWKTSALLLGAGMIWAPLTWSSGALACMAVLLAALTFLCTYTHDQADESFWTSQVLLFGLLYLPFLLRMARHLAAPEIALVLLATFATDTAAYYTGSFLGGPKIWPAVSPKKTWAGSLGGFLACILVCALLGFCLGTVPWTRFMALGAALNIAAQMGDFFESALKRWRGIKDSGRALPGHGGILDRIDSLLFTLPLYCGLAAVYPFFHALP
ncbi:phosphatidate cytidylyltransferase [Desulfovibrionales bacterium]